MKAVVQNSVDNIFCLSFRAQARSPACQPIQKLTAGREESSV